MNPHGVWAPPDFESGASASSTTPACSISYILLLNLYYTPIPMFFRLCSLPVFFIFFSILFFPNFVFCVCSTRTNSPLARHSLLIWVYYRGSFPPLRLYHFLMLFYLNYTFFKFILGFTSGFST